MENNLPTNQTSQGPLSQQSAPTQPVQPVAQQPPSAIPQQGAPVNKSHVLRTLLIMMAFSVIVLLVTYIYIWFSNKQALDSYSVQIENAASPVPTKSAEQELNNIDVGDVEDDLKDIDTDLQGL